MIDGQAHGPQRGTATCQLHMRKFASGAGDRHRAVAGHGVPDHQGPDGRPGGVRPHRRGRRLHHRPDRWRARRQPHPDPQAGRRRGDGRRRVHRLRCLRGGVPERRGQPVHRGEGRATSTCCRRARPSATAGSRRWSRRWTSTSVRARTTASARRPARRASRIDFIALMNKDYLKAKFKQPQRAQPHLSFGIGPLLSAYRAHAGCPLSICVSEQTRGTSERSHRPWGRPPPMR